MGGLAKRHNKTNSPMLRTLCFFVVAVSCASALPHGIFKTCRYNIDAADIKCYDAFLSGFFPHFKLEGFDRDGECPWKYDTVINATQEQICDDGKTNLKYCKERGLKLVTVKLSTKVPHSMVLGDALVATNVSAAEAIWPFETCLHNEDATDGKCNQACARVFRSFKMAGFVDGKCPGKYKVTLNSAPEEICSDGKTNINDCEKEGAHT